MIGIYKITSPDNKIYIGQSVQIHSRILKYKRIDKGTKVQTRLYRSLCKYGFESHTIEVIKECNIDDLNKINLLRNNTELNNRNKKTI